LILREIAAMRVGISHASPRVARHWQTAQ